MIPFLKHHLEKEMKPAIKTLLIEALKSGDYKKTSGRMRRGDRFCALGILCNLHAQAHPKFAATQKVKGMYDGTTHMPPTRVQKWSGITSSEVYKIVSWNDDSKLSFREIAQQIERDFE